MVKNKDMKKKQKTIFIDARWISLFGIGRYTEEILLNLSKIIDKDIQVKFLTLESSPDLDLGSNFIQLKKQILWFGFAEQFKLSYILFKLKPDLAHFLNFNIPILWFLLSRKKKIVTIHDLTLLSFRTTSKKVWHPKGLIYEIKNLITRLVLMIAIKKSTYVITPSEYVKKEIVKKYKVSQEKVIATPLGLGHRFKAAVSTDIKSNKKILTNLGINKPYIIYVGNVYPHKNLTRLVLAFGRLITKYGLDLQLVFVGSKDRYRETIHKSIEGSDLNKRVIFTDFLPDEELGVVYSQANACVHPSLAEGFGLGVLEAFAYKVPLISSNATSLPEVAGDGALYFNPLNINEMSDKMFECLSNPNLAESLVRRGTKQLQKFDFQNTTKQTYEIYTKCLEKNE